MANYESGTKKKNFHSLHLETVCFIIRLFFIKTSLIYRILLDVPLPFFSFFDQCWLGHASLKSQQISRWCWGSGLYSPVWCLTTRGLSSGPKMDLLLALERTWGVRLCLNACKMHSIHSCICMIFLLLYCHMIGWLELLNVQLYRRS